VHNKESTLMTSQLETLLEGILLFAWRWLSAHKLVVQGRVWPLYIMCTTHRLFNFSSTSPPTIIVKQISDVTTMLIVKTVHHTPGAVCCATPPHNIFRGCKSLCKKFPFSFVPMYTISMHVILAYSLQWVMCPKQNR
jgi:hypothetical protein